MQIYSSYCAYLCANYFSVNNLPLICHACVGIRNCCQLSDMSEEGAGSILISISPQGFSRKRLHPRLQTLYLAVANVIPGGRMYLPCRTQVRAGAVASTCRNGCKYLRLNLDQIGSADALHCRTGCSALQDGLQCTAGRVAVHCVENHSFSPSLTDYVMSSEMRVSSRVHAYVYI